MKPGDSERTNLTLRFSTPLDLKARGVPVGIPEFAPLIRRLRDRANALATFFADGPLTLDFKGISALAEGVSLVKNGTRLIEVNRTSSRTGQRHDVGGLIGEAAYEGEGIGRRDFRRHRLSLAERDLLVDENLAAIEARYRYGEAVLVVATTVARAQILFDRLVARLGSSDVSLLHGRFTAEGRAKKENDATWPSRADGVVALAESYLAGNEATGNGGERFQVMLHVDQEPLAPDGVLAGTLDDGTRVSAETLRRVACDCGLVAVTGAGADLNIGRRSRSIPPALRRVLALRDRGCCFPGCTHDRFLHGHHIQNWLHGGETSVENISLLCTAHHHLVHEGAWSVARTPDGALSFTAPDGRVLPPVPAARPTRIPSCSCANGPRSAASISARTQICPCGTEPVPTTTGRWGHCFKVRPTDRPGCPESSRIFL